METLSVREVRRLALARAGLLNRAWTKSPSRARGRGKQARAACQAIIERFGYLQLDTVSIAGARSHALVLLARLEGLDPKLPEELLRPGGQLFEYWGHEASWLPLELYPVFAFRRREFREHPWWGDIVGQNPDVTDNLMRRIRDDGPIRSIDMEGRGSRGWWDLKVAKRVASQLWSSGVLAIRTRRNFQRSYDLAERVIPAELLGRETPLPEALKILLLRALAGHGWAQTGTLASTWRLRNLQKEVKAALDELVESEEILPCSLQTPDGHEAKGWIRPDDLSMAKRLRRIRPRFDKGVLLSPFDPVLWDRSRTRTLFGFDQVLEIFKPAPQRIYGYYCLPILAGDQLVARVDLKANRQAGLLKVLSLRFEQTDLASATIEEAARSALERYSEALDLRVVEA